VRDATALFRNTYRTMEWLENFDPILPWLAWTRRFACMHVTPSSTFSPAGAYECRCERDSQILPAMHHHPGQPAFTVERVVESGESSGGSVVEIGDRKMRRWEMGDR
jgi:hypothetical protein